MSWLATKYRQVAFVCLCLRPMFRAFTGRYFVWRDSPTWVVKGYFDLMSPDKQKDNPRYAGDIENLWEQARDELLLRDRT